MELRRNKVCGIDVHKRFLIATILSRDGKKDTQRFSVTPGHFDSGISELDEIHPGEDR